MPEETIKVPQRVRVSRREHAVSTDRQRQTLGCVRSRSFITTYLPTSQCWHKKNTVHRETLELPYPALSPDLTPCGFFFFFLVPHLKKCLNRRMLNTRSNLGAVVLECILHTPQNDFNGPILRTAPLEH